MIGGGLASTIYKQQHPELYGSSTYSARMQNNRDQYLGLTARAMQRAAEISKTKSPGPGMQQPDPTPGFTFGELLGSRGGAFLVGIALIGMSGFRG